MQFDRLGELLGPRPPASQILGDFPASPTGDATWAPPLLAIMLLIGLGGFVRVGLSARRRS